MRFSVHALAAAFALSALSAHGAGLNDTGQTQCYDASNNVAACATVAADNGVLPRQDARFGRDAKTGLAKTGGGAAGFDFTALDAGGIATTPGSHACVKDNVTNLIWSTETLSGVTWSAAGTAASAYSRCGYASGWRMPTRRELFSIVHRGTSNPAIDTAYFPNTVSSWYWSSDITASDSAVAWVVYFGYGSTDAFAKTYSNYVRLVRSGQ